MILFTEILEECNLRGYPYPGPITIAEYRSSLDHAFDPIPDMNRVFDEYGLRSKPFLLKFGEPRWLGPSFECGKFRIASAFYYDSDAHNHARRDTELERFIRLNPKNPKYGDLAKLTSPQATALAVDWTSIASPSDYLLFSLSASYTSRLFGDFAATSCLAVFEPKTFLNRVMKAITQQLPRWHIEFTRVIYYDPVRVDPSAIIVPKFKPFRHAYQHEMRVVCLPPNPVPKLPPLEIEVGPLADCATLVDLTTHLPPPLPHDPSEDPIQMFGNVNPESSMVHRHPDAVKV